MPRSSMPNAEFKIRYREMMRRAFGDVDDTSIELFGNLMKAQHILSSIVERHMGQYELSRAKMGVLMWLNALDQDDAGSGLLPSQLSRMQGVMPNTVSSLLNSLREQELIEQTRHPQDRRKRIIRITQAGRDLLREVGPRYNAFVREMFAGLSDEDKREMIGLLQKMFESFQKAAEKLEGCDPAALAAEQHQRAEDHENHDREENEGDEDHGEGVGVRAGRIRRRRGSIRRTPSP